MKPPRLIPRVTANRQWNVEMSIGYESRMCSQAVKGGLPGGHKSTPVKPKSYAIPPSLQLPICGQLTRLVHENGQPLKHILYGTTVCLSGTISFRLQACLRPATIQSRLHGVLGRKSMYETFLTETVGSGLYSFVLYTRKRMSVHSPIFT